MTGLEYEEALRQVREFCAESCNSRITESIEIIVDRLDDLEGRLPLRPFDLIFKLPFSGQLPVYVALKKIEWAWPSPETRGSGTLTINKRKVDELPQLVGPDDLLQAKGTGPLVRLVGTVKRDEREALLSYVAARKNASSDRSASTPSKSRRRSRCRGPRP